MMTIQVKHGIILTAILLISNLVFIASATTLIPEKCSEVEAWFDKIVTPLSERKKEIDADIVEAEKAEQTITVRKDGSGKFKTIAEALNKVKIRNEKRVIIDIGPGDYEEKITVERFKPYVTLYGDPKNPPTIAFAGTTEEYGGLSDSATMIVEADNFVGANLIIKNSSPPPKGEKTEEQGITLKVSGDEAAFYNCKIYGYQNTLCDDMGKHLFKDCYIEGTKNFIYGEATSTYLNSELHVVDSVKEGVIAANARKNDKGVGGFSFVHCNISGKGNKAYLGRPWAEGARVVYSFCEMSDVVKPEGWTIVNNTEAERTVFFGEYKNKGPGAKVDKRVKYAKQLTEKEAEEFISMEYIEAAHWLLPKPATKGSTPPAKGDKPAKKDATDAAVVETPTAQDSPSA